MLLHARRNNIAFILNDVEPFCARLGTLLKAKLTAKEDITFAALLSEATQCGNMMIQVNGSTPYQVIFGCQPAILPDLEIDTDPDLRGRYERRTVRSCSRN